MTVPVRIMQLVNTLDFGGATDYALTLSEHLDSDRFQSYLGHGPGEVWASRARECSVEVLSLDSMKPTHIADSKNSVVGDILSLWRLFRFLKSHDIQILHTHGSKTRLIGGIAALLARVPVRIQSAHGFAFNSHQPPWKRFCFAVVERFMGFLYHELVLESKHDLKIATEHDLGRSKRCIYTGIRFDKLEKIDSGASKRQEIGVSEDAVVVTMVGRVTEQKDPHTFVKVAHEVLRSFPQAVFIIVGDGDLYETTKDLIGDSTNIRMLGRRADADAIIAVSDIYLLCSRWEGIPLTILSAMYFGKPIIATNTLGLPEVVVDGVTGLLAPEGDYVKYAQAVVELVENEELRLRLGSNAAELVQARHSLVSMIEEFERMYIDHMHRRTGRSAKFISL